MQPQYTPAGAPMPAAPYYPPQYPTQPTAYPTPPMPGAYPAQSYPAPTAPPQAPPPVQQATPGELANPGTVAQIPRPRIMDIGVGRLVLIKPKRVETVKNDLSDDPNATQERLTADVVVLDGPPFAYGGKPEKGIPHTQTSTPPQMWPDCWLSQDLIVRQCKGEIGSGKYVLGRLARGQASDPRRNAPWRIDDPTEDDKAAARAYLASGALSAPAQTMSAPVPPAVNVPPMPGPVVSGPPPQAPPAPVWNPSTGQWDFPGQPPAVPTQANPAAAQMAASYIGSPDPGAQYQPQGYAPQMPAQPAAYPPAAPPAPGLDVNTPPAGMDPAVWQTLTVEQRTAIAQSAAARPPWQ